MASEPRSAATSFPRTAMELERVILSTKRSEMSQSVENMSQEVRKQEHALKDIGGDTDVIITEMHKCKQRLQQRQLDIRIFKAKRWRERKNTLKQMNVGMDFIHVNEEDDYFRKMQRYVEEVEMISYELNKVKREVRIVTNPSASLCEKLEMLQELLTMKKGILCLLEEIVDIKDQMNTYQGVLYNINPLNEYQIGTAFKLKHERQRSAIAYLLIKMQNLEAEYGINSDLVAVKEKTHMVRNSVASGELSLNAFKARIREDTSGFNNDDTTIMMRSERTELQLLRLKSQLSILEEAGNRLDDLKINLKKRNILISRIENLEKSINYQKYTIRTRQPDALGGQGTDRNTLDNTIAEILSASQELSNLDDEYDTQREYLDLMYRKQKPELDGLGLEKLGTVKIAKTEHQYKTSLLVKANQRDEKTGTFLMKVIQDKLNAHISQVTELENNLNEVKALTRTVAMIEVQKEVQLKRCELQLAEAKKSLDLFEDRYHALMKLNDLRQKSNKLSAKVAGLEVTLNSQKAVVRSCTNLDAKTKEQFCMNKICDVMYITQVSLDEVLSEYESLQEDVREKTRQCEKGRRNLSYNDDENETQNRAMSNKRSRSTPLHCSLNTLTSDQAAAGTGLEKVLRCEHTLSAEERTQKLELTSWKDRINIATAQISASEKEIQFQHHLITVIEKLLNRAKRMAKKASSPIHGYELEECDYDDINRLEKSLVQAKAILKLVESYHQSWLEMLNCIRSLCETQEKVSNLEDQLNFQKTLYHKSQDEKDIQELDTISANLSAACQSLQELDERYSALLEFVLSCERTFEKEQGWCISKRTHSLNRAQLSKM